MADRDWADEKANEVYRNWRRVRNADDQDGHDLLERLIALAARQARAEGRREGRQEGLKALQEHGQHRMGCDLMRAAFTPKLEVPEADCTCGLSAAERALAQQDGQ